MTQSIDLDARVGNFYIKRFIHIVLTLLTLGLYLPWAITNEREYLWKHIFVKGQRLQYHGKAMDLFKVFIIAYFLFAIFIMFFSYCMLHDKNWIFPVLGFFSFLIFFTMVPWGLFYNWRYKVINTSIQGRHFSFHGNFREFFWLYLKWLVYTVLSLSIYGLWMRVNVRRFMISHTQYGAIKFAFRGSGLQLFKLIINGLLMISALLGSAMLLQFFYLKIPFSIVSKGAWLSYENTGMVLGAMLWVVIGGLLIISFIGFYIHRFRISKLRMKVGNTYIEFKTTAHWWDILVFVLGNVVMVLLTFGLGILFYEIKLLRFSLKYIDWREEWSWQKIQEVNTQHD